ncbi:putative Late nodulin [Medicago truncatula]|uniref:Putative Late nodulin n=1 Tax=Medicago truncatula TaxID=3880 RepID=A0A396I014_MEDTR|nr:putative Late nodulin [Medicago truncatula]
MQIGKNMAETPKLVYVLVLFLFIFLSIIVCNSSFLKFFDGRCETDKDCPKVPGANVRCRKGHCVQI